ncbi:uncharacterized protein LOC143281192 isoform X2 [Babylonia areolata]|uniref:uncharacterized protein LOC143281192 isoform X2 n=1 Tax=Babylonia areolata TaxID=304850 RepID=UPI003FD3B95D
MAVEMCTDENHQEEEPTLSAGETADIQGETQCAEADHCTCQSSDYSAEAPREGEKSIRGAFTERLTQSLPPQAVYMATAVIAVLWAVCMYHFYGTSISRLQTTGLVESLEKHGYSGDCRVQVRKHRYGSPDLLTPKLKEKLVAQWSQAVDTLTKRSGGEGGCEAEGVARRLKGADDCPGPEEQYVVVYDAGSTGTRLHVFQFLCQNGGINLKQEVFQKSKPGLSEFVLHPQRGADSLHPMITAAMEKVSAPLHSTTPLIFKATAGFRLLNTTGANGLLTQIRERFAQTDFLFKPEDINILSGREEGLFAWMTINYLSGKLDGGRCPTAAAIDLGGASMQLTYQPDSTDDFTEKLDNLRLMGTDYSLYTHSYLGMGLLAARNSTLKDRVQPPPRRTSVGGRWGGSSPPDRYGDPGIWGAVGVVRMSSSSPTSRRPLSGLEFWAVRQRRF